MAVEFDVKTPGLFEISNVLNRVTEHLVAFGSSQEVLLADSSHNVWGHAESYAVAVAHGECRNELDVSLQRQ